MTENLRINIGPWRYEHIYRYGEVPGLEVSYRNTSDAFFVENGGWLAVYTSVIPGHDSALWKLCSRFVEIPKTGSRSIVDAMARRTGEKGPFRSYGHMYGVNFPEWMWPELKTVVRNPYDRLVSAYHFIKRGGFYQNERYRQIIADHPTFQDFVGNYLCADHTAYAPDVDGNIRSWPKAPWRELFVAQSEWICDQGALILAPENLARFEDFDREVERVFGIANPAQKNVSADKAPWQDYYQDKDVAEKVFDIYRADFDLLGYPKDIA